MICKYCGAAYSGKQCGSCGRVTPLVKRSVSLDLLMAGEETPSSGSKAPVVPSAGSKTYDQGVREGYQKGLREGYQNGIKDGQQKSVPSPTSTPGPDPAGEQKSALRPKMNTRILAAAAAAVLAVGGTLGGVIGRSAGRNEGVTEGRTQAEAAFRTEAEAYERKISEQDAALAEAAQKAEENAVAISSLEEQVTQQAAVIQAYEEQEAARAGSAGTEEARIQKAREEGEAAGRKAAEKERYDEAYKAGKADGEEAGRAQGTEEGYRAGHDFALTLSFPYSRKRDGGQKSQAVLWIQKQLNAVNRRKIAEDGIYGSKTVAAVRDLQKNKGLPQTGEVDQATYCALFGLPLPASASEGEKTGGKGSSADPAAIPSQEDGSNPTEDEPADPADGANHAANPNPADETENEADLHQEDMNPGETVPTVPAEDVESQENTTQNTQENILDDNPDAGDPVSCNV